MGSVKQARVLSDDVHLEKNRKDEWSLTAAHIEWRKNFLTKINTRRSYGGYFTPRAEFFMSFRKYQ